MGPRTRHVDRTILFWSQRLKQRGMGYRGPRSHWGLVILRKARHCDRHMGPWTRLGGVLHGELWVVGGENSRRTERLDAVTNQWVRGPDMIEIRVCFCLAVFRGQLWAVGGFEGNGDSFSSCEYLDAAANTWMAGPSMNTARRDHGLAVVDGQLWAVGGHSGRRSFQSCELLGATANAWVAAPDLPVPTSEHSCVAH